MSKVDAREWLLSHKNESQITSNKKRAKTICFTSGKGGVGKTSACVKFGKILSELGCKVLILDCDYNLSNTAFKLGLPFNNQFRSFIDSQVEFEDAVIKDGNLHLLSACNGDLDLVGSKIHLEKIIIDLLIEQERNYDYILLDCPAGLSKDNLVLNAYCDHRFVIITPDKSSITDSYSLVKVLNHKFGVHDFDLLLNKVSSSKQSQRLVNSFVRTSFQFLNCRVGFLGSVPFLTKSVEEFDRELFKVADSEIQKSFYQIVSSFAEKNVDTCVADEMPLGSFHPLSSSNTQEVLTTA